MNRLRVAVIAGILAGFISGCGDDQTGHPAQPNEVTPDFAKNTADMMKNANTGIPDPKGASAAGKATPKP